MTYYAITTVQKQTHHYFKPNYGPGMQWKSAEKIYYAGILGWKT